MELKNELVLRRSSIPKSSMAGQPRIVFTETSEPRAMQRTVGVELVSVYGRW